MTCSCFPQKPIAPSSAHDLGCDFGPACTCDFEGWKVYPGGRHHYGCPMAKAKPPSSEAPAVQRYRKAKEQILPDLKALEAEDKQRIFDEFQVDPGLRVQRPEVDLIKHAEEGTLWKRDVEKAKKAQKIFKKMVKKHAQTPAWKALKKVMGYPQYFRPCGSRYYGTHREDSDYDFVTCDFGPQQRILEEIGLQQLDLFKTDSNTIAVWELKDEGCQVQVCVVKDMALKFLVGNAINSNQMLLGIDLSLKKSPIERRKFWDTLYALARRDKIEGKWGK